MQNLLLSLDANGENIIIGSNKEVKQKVHQIIDSVAAQICGIPYMENLLRVRKQLKLITTPYLKVRINPSGEMFIKPFKTLEDIAIEINLTLSEL